MRNVQARNRKLPSTTPLLLKFRPSGLRQVSKLNSQPNNAYEPNYPYSGVAIVRASSRPVPMSSMTAAKTSFQIRD
jgi:hypothetical protein